MTFILLTRRDHLTDFRVYLAAALQASGHPCYIIRPFKRSTVSSPFSTDTAMTVGVFGLLRLFRAIVASHKPVVVIDSLNLGVPLLCTILRFLSLRAAWAYDIHDNLLYDLQGPARWIGIVKLRLHLALASLTFHAAPTLSELFPNSHRLGNASHLCRGHGERASINNILVLASIDERFNFDLIQTLSCNKRLHFHIYGSVAEGSTRTTGTYVSRQLSTLLDKENITYHGSYNNTDLGTILSRFSVMLAPYKPNDRSTYYIEPLRFYHCLNNGVSVITTDIPAAHLFPGYIKIIHSRESFEDALSQIADERSNGNVSNMETTWGQRATQLIAIASTHLSKVRR